MKFNFQPLSDLGLSLEEMATIDRLFKKQRVNRDAWNCTEQAFFEAFIRCLRVAVPCNAVPSVVVAQAIIESGWFSTGVLFGVKATAAQVAEGDIKDDKTTEVVNGKLVVTQGKFFHGGIQEQFANYYSYLARRKPGTEQFLPADAMGFVGYLQNAQVKAASGSASGAYSTAGQDYCDTVLAVVKDNGLQVFDHA